MKTGQTSPASIASAAPPFPRRLSANLLTALLMLLVMATACGSNSSDAPKSSGPSMIVAIHDQAELESIMEKGGGRLMLLDLYADWCGPCHQLLPVLEAIAREHRDSITVYKIDVDRNEAIARRFGVRGIPHVVFVRGGKTLLNLQGLQPKTNYEKAIRKFTEKTAGMK